MPYVNDMQTLANVVGGGAAAQQMGIQDDLANQKEQMANQVYQNQMPALSAEPGLKNLFTQAQTGNEQGLAAQNIAKGDVDTALVPGQIQAGKAELTGKYNAAQVQQFGQLGQISGQIAGMMDNTPQAARPARMAQIAQMYGIEPERLGTLMNGDPDELRNFSQKMIQSSQQYQEKLMEEQTKGQYQLQTAGIVTGGRQQVAQTNKEAKQYVVDQQKAVREATAGMGAVVAQWYKAVANGTATPEIRAALDSYNKVQQLTRQGQPFPAAITGTQVPSNVPNVPDTSNMGGGQGPAAPQQAAPQEPTSGNAVEAEMRRRGLIK